MGFCDHFFQDIKGFYTGVSTHSRQNFFSEQRRTIKSIQNLNINHLQLDHSRPIGPEDSSRIILAVSFVQQPSHNNGLASNRERNWKQRAALLNNNGIITDFPFTTRTNKNPRHRFCNALGPSFKLDVSILRRNVLCFL